MKLIISAILTSFLMFSTVSMAKTDTSSTSVNFNSNMSNAVYYLSLAKDKKDRLANLSKAKQLLVNAKSKKKNEHKIKAVSFVEQALKLTKRKKMVKSDKFIDKTLHQIELAIILEAKRDVKSYTKEDNKNHNAVKKTKKNKRKFVVNKNQPNMKAALAFLKKAKRAKNKEKMNLLLKARKSLKTATPNKGGRRVKAIEFTNKAIKCLKKKNDSDVTRFISKAIFNTKKGIKYADKH